MSKEVLIIEELQPLGNTESFWIDVFSEAYELNNEYLQSDPSSYYYDKNQIEGANIFRDKMGTINPLVAYFNTNIVSDYHLRKIITVFESEAFKDIIARKKGNIPESIEKIGGINTLTRLLVSEKNKKSVEEITKPCEEEEKETERTLPQNILNTIETLEIQNTLNSNDTTEEELLKTLQSYLDNHNKTLISLSTVNSTTQGCRVISIKYREDGINGIQTKYFPRPKNNNQSRF